MSSNQYTLRGKPQEITSSAVRVVTDEHGYVLQVECSIGQHGFAVRIDDVEMANFLAWMFTHAATRLREAARGTRRGRGGEMTSSEQARADALRGAGQ